MTLLPPPYEHEGVDERTSTTWRLGTLGRRTWLRALAFALAAGTMIAIPTRLVPNGLFSRMTPARPQDYVFLVISASLLGLTLALRSVVPEDSKVAAGGIGTVFAVGCPVCNKLVVALLGTGGALSIFAPLQPLLGAGAAGLLLVGVRRQLRALGGQACPVPVEA
jgi:hypothetical protein